MIPLILAALIGLTAANPVYHVPVTLGSHGWIALNERQDFNSPIVNIVEPTVVSSVPVFKIITIGTPIVSQNLEPVNYIRKSEVSVPEVLNVPTFSEIDNLPREESLISNTKSANTKSASTVDSALQVVDTKAVFSSSKTSDSPAPSSVVSPLIKSAINRHPIAQSTKLIAEPIVPKPVVEYSSPIVKSTKSTKTGFSSVDEYSSASLVKVAAPSEVSVAVEEPTAYVASNTEAVTSNTEAVFPAPLLKEAVFPAPLLKEAVFPAPVLKESVFPAPVLKEAVALPVIDVSDVAPVTAIVEEAVFIPETPALSQVIVAEAIEPLQAPDPPMPSVEIPFVGGQFHSQDESGQYTFGHYGGPNTRVEVRDSLGRTAGSFAYVDPEGDVQIRKYASNPSSGFRVAASDLPTDPNTEI